MMENELKRLLVIIGFEDDIKEIPKMSVINKRYKMTARRVHPDKHGGTEEAKQEFQRLRDAIEKVESYLHEFTNGVSVIPDDEEEEFANTVFKQFNLQKENTNSFTILIENERSAAWEASFEKKFGKQIIPKGNKSNGKHWNDTNTQLME